MNRTLFTGHSAVVSMMIPSFLLLWVSARGMPNGGHCIITDLFRDNLQERRVGVPCWLGVDSQPDLASYHERGPEENHGQPLYSLEATELLSGGARLGTWDIVCP